MHRAHTDTGQPTTTEASRSQGFPTSMAIAAAAAAVHPSPPLLARRAVAWLACTHLARAAVDAVICLFLASMWLLYWGLATMEIGRLACGEGCAVVTAAYQVVSVAAVVTLVLLLPFILLALMMARAQAAAAAATATDIEATEEPAPETFYAAMRDTLCDSLTLVLLAFMALSLLMVIGDLVKLGSPVMGSRRERMGSLIHGVGAFGKVMVNCFVFCPVMSVSIWRFWRMARHAL